MRIIMTIGSDIMTIQHIKNLELQSSRNEMKIAAKILARKVKEVSNRLKIAA